MPLLDTLDAHQRFRRWVAIILLPAASLLFWLTWYLMPDAATNDAPHILSAVGAHRDHVYVSALIQIVSSAFFIPPLIYLVAQSSNRTGAFLVQVGACAFLMGACGMAMDAVYHQVAFEMTLPGSPINDLLPVMTRLQTEDIKSLLPMMGAILVGAPLLGFGLWRAGLCRGYIPTVIGVSFLVIPLGIIANLLFDTGRRTIALSFLGVLSSGIALIAVSLARNPSHRSPV